MLEFRYLSQSEKNASLLFVGAITIKYKNDLKLRMKLLARNENWAHHSATSIVVIVRVQTEKTTKKIDTGT